jgi:ankyrin repeat protein
VSNDKRYQNCADLFTDVLDRFLLPRLHLDHLGNQINVRKLREALDVLPSKLDETYASAMTRIQGQVPEYRDLALRTLSWISSASRPLRLEELLHALAVEPGDKGLDEDDSITESLLVTVCAGLVTLDVESSTIRLVHFTVEEYFKKTRQTWFPDADTQIARICLTYLSFDVFEKGFCGSDKELDDRLRQYPLFEYAAKNWGRHLLSVIDENVKSIALTFLIDRLKVAASGQAMLLPEYRFDGYSQFTSSDIHGIHVAAHFGLKDATLSLLQLGVNIEVNGGGRGTALGWAAWEGHEAVIRLLLERGADLEAKSKFGVTALGEAAGGGHEAVVRLLLERGADLEAKGERGVTALGEAARRGQEAVVRLLLERGADLEAKSKFGGTALGEAARRGHEAVVRLLLERGADIEAKGERGRTALGEAARRGQEAVVRLLLERGADIEAKSEFGGTALGGAAEGGHEAVVRLLLERGANLEAKGEWGRTALGIADSMATMRLCSY